MQTVETAPDARPEVHEQVRTIGEVDHADPFAAWRADPDGENDNDDAGMPDEVHESPVFIDDRPKIDAALQGARDSEPAAATAADFNAVTARYPADVTADAAERAQVLDGFVSAGLGVTAGAALWQAGLDALRSPVQTTEAGAREALGDKADSLVSAAREVVSRAEKSWPGIKDFLNKTGLGNDPATIRFLAKRGRT